MYVCLCKAIKDSDVKRAIDGGANSVKCLSKQLGLAKDCGRCGQHAKAILADYVPDFALVSNAAIN